MPQNRFYEELSNYARTSSPLTYVVHRPKRIDAVIKKLKREPNAQLSTMHDIAGCRAIVKSIDDVEPFIEACKQMWSGHTFKPYDYIEKPNPKTGYRGVHLVFKYRSDNPAFDGRLIEVQIRTREQHAWATAVETVDIIHKDSLKSGHGDPRWQKFFSLMSSAIAYRESRPLVPSTPSDPGILENELRRTVTELQVQRRLQTYGAIARIAKPWSQITSEDVSDPDRFWFYLIELNVESSETSTSVKLYRRDEIRQAYQAVAEAENAGKTVVLAGAHDFEQLREAYPNWFIDTHNFLMILSRTLSEDIDYRV